ncbi:hypothetical protein VTJ04DRAFT_3926 [Mycothermus thermophilus]|uniref:uncharacterized protein n=1 Tax=Humicola insolens TaxID=85995 RepID=UPI0037448426
MSSPTGTTSDLRHHAVGMGERGTGPGNIPLRRMGCQYGCRLAFMKPRQPSWTDVHLPTTASRPFHQPSG